MHQIRLKVLRFSNVLSYGANVNEVIFGDGLTWIKGPNGAGKAQPLSSMVCTPSGFVPMGDIKLNDFVSNPDGSVSKVVGVYPQGCIRTYKVTLKDGSEVECSGDHLWRGYFTGCKYTDGVYTTLDILDKWKEKSHLKGNHFKGFVLPFIEPVEFKSAPMPIEPYLLGALLGDGSFRTGMVTFTNIEPHILNKVEYEIGKYGCCFGKESNHTRSIKSKVRKGKWFTSHNTLKNKIDKMGLYGKNSLEKFIPLEYLTASISDRIKLLQGLLDTDGYIDKGGSIYYYTISPKLVDGVKFIVESLGGYVNITTKMGSYKKNGIKQQCQRIYNVYIKLNRDDIVTLPRKRDRLKSKQSYNRIIQSIKYIGNKECQCIRVDNPNHLYLTDNFIPTHNSTVIEALNFALFSTSFRKMTKGELKNTANKGKLKVELEFEREDAKGVYQFSVIREMGKSSTKTIFSKDGVEQSKEAGYSQKVFEEEVLGFNQNIFENVISLNTIETTPFIDMDPGKKRKLIESMLTLQIDKFKDINKKSLKEAQTKLESAKSDVVKYDKDVIELEWMLSKLKSEQSDDIDELEAKINETKTLIEQHNASINDIQAEYDKLISEGTSKGEALKKHPNYSAIIKQINSARGLLTTIETLKGQLAEKNNALNVAIDNVKDANHNFTEIDIELIKSKKNELEAIQKVVAGLESILDLTNTQREAIEKKGKELKAGVECPTCGKPSTEDDIEALKKEYRVQWKSAKDVIDKHTKDIKSNNKSIKVLKQEIKSLEDKLTEYEDAQRKLDSAEQVRVRIQGDYDAIDSEYNDFLKKLSDTGYGDKSHEELDEMISDNEEKELERSVLEKEISDLRSDVRLLTANINNIKNTVNELGESINTLTKKIENKKSKSDGDSISLMEKKIAGTRSDFDRAKVRVTKYSDEISITKYIESMYDDDGIKKIVLGIFVPNLNKAIAHNLNLFSLPFMIEFDDAMDYRFDSRFGLAPSYNALSQGQKRKLNFAIAVAFRDFVTSIADFKINILFLDEVLDISTDEEALEHMIQLLKAKVPEIGGTYLMTHRGEQFSEYFDHCIQVQNNGRYSSLEMTELPKSSNY